MTIRIFRSLASAGLGASAVWLTLVVFRLAEVDPSTAALFGLAMVHLAIGALAGAVADTLEGRS